jgi:hypothetical protein
MADNAGAVHDAASLLRFVESIRKFCEVRNGYPAFLPASQTFLEFIEQLAQATKKHLSTFPSRSPAGKDEFPIYRQELFTLREAWSEIHRRVKPIADADTLHVPSALIKSLERRLQTVDRFRETQFAVLHTEWLNYLQVVASRIRSTADDIATLVGARSFPPRIGLIGIPYSQSESIFLNCLIAHEVGHFVFGELELKKSLGIIAHRILNSVFAPIAPSLPRDNNLRQIPTTFAGWTEELFCDLFAVRLIGPCYSYAYVEIFDLPNILHLDGTLNASAAATSLVFSDSHPADLYRISKQTQLLQRLGWWTQVSNSKSNIKKVLEHSIGLSLASFSIPSFPNVEKTILDALDQMVNEIVNAVENSLSGLDSGVREYIQLNKIVREYLLHGVVPSVVPEPSSKRARKPKKKNPNPVTILNVSYQLYLDSLPELLARIKDLSASSVTDRANWTQRLETWTLKALDDLELIWIRPTPES